MATKVLMNHTSYEESKTIDLGSGTDFTCDLSQAQRFVVTLTGDATMTLTQPVLMQDQEITLLVKCAVARTVTLPANCYNAAGALATFTFLPSGVVGAGGHALVGVVTSNGIFWDDGSSPAGSIPDTALASKITKDVGQGESASIVATSNTLAGATVLVAVNGGTSHTYEFGGVNPNDPAVSGVNAAGSIANLAASITAVQGSGGTSEVVAARLYTVSPVMGMYVVAANGFVTITIGGANAGNLTKQENADNRAAANVKMCCGNRAVTAAEANAGAFDHFVIVTPLTTVYSAIVQLRSSTGAQKAWDGKLSNVTGTGMYHLDNTGATDMAAGDFVHWIITGV